MVSFILPTVILLLETAAFVYWVRNRIKILSGQFWVASILGIGMAFASIYYGYAGYSLSLRMTNEGQTEFINAHGWPFMWGISKHVENSKEISIQDVLPEPIGLILNFIIWGFFPHTLLVICLLLKQSIDGVSVKPGATFSS